LINQAAFETWIFKFRPTNAADIEDLLDAAGYAALTDD